MNTIWKFELETTDRQKIKMPKGARIITVQTQNEAPCLWAVVNCNYEMEDRIIEIVGTGHNINSTPDSDLIYLGTYQLRKGSLVFYVFERVLQTLIFNR